MYNNINDMSIQQSTLNHSILDLFENLRLNQSEMPNPGKIAYETLLLKVFHTNSQLSHELTLKYLHCIKSDSFIQDMMNDALDKTILRKLRRAVTKSLFDGDKIHLIHILLCFIEFYMVKPSNAEFSTKIFTKFEIEKIDVFIPKDKMETALAKLHIKSFIGLIFSLPFNYKFSYTKPSGENLLNQLIIHIEKLVTSKDQFYRSYSSKQLLKVFINAKEYCYSNKSLVRDYMRHCIYNKSQFNVLKNVLSSAGSYYYQSVLVLNWYNTLTVNRNETEPYALAQVKYDTDINKRLLYFGSIKEDMISLIQTLFCDSFNGFPALNYVQSVLEVIIDQLAPSFEEKSKEYSDNNAHLLYSYLISIAFFNQFINESEKLNHIDINKEHYLSKGEYDFKSQLGEVKTVLSKSKAKLIGFFFFENKSNITQEDIDNEIKSVRDRYVLMSMLILLNCIYKKSYYFKCDINHIKAIILLVIEQFFEEMILYRYYSIICFSFILETHKLYAEMPDKLNYFESSKMNSIEYSQAYIYHEMYEINYMMKTNTPIKNITDFIYRQYDGLLRCVLLPEFKYSKTKLNYLLLHLQMMNHIISGDPGAFTLIYCSSCFKKLNNDRGMRQSKYLFECAKCKRSNLMMVFDEEYMNSHIKHDSIQKGIIYPSLSIFAQKLSLTLELFDSMKKFWKYKVLGLIIQFILSSQFYYKDILTTELKEKIMLVRNKKITMTELKDMRDYYKKRKMVKWYKICQNFVIE